MPMLTALLLGFAQAPDDATLIVFRDHAEPVLFAPTLLVDGARMGKLGHKRLIALPLPPGEHRVEVRWPMLATQRPARATVNLQPGGRHYLELSATARAGIDRGGSALIQHPLV